MLVAVLAAASGGLGWLIGGLTTALLFAFCSLLAATAVYRYGDRALLGMLGARPFALAEDPVLRSGADKIAAKLGVRAPQLYLIDDGFPRLFAVGRGPSSSTLAISVGALRSLRREELEAAMAHELAHVRRRDVLVQTFVVLFATTLVELSRHRRLVLALSPLHLRADQRGVRPPHAVAKARAARRCARCDGDGKRARSRGRTHAPRSRRRARRVRSVAGDRAALPDRPVRARRPRAHVQDAPPTRPAYPSPARARRGPERPRPASSLSKLAG